MCEIEDVHACVIGLVFEVPLRLVIVVLNLSDSTLNEALILDMVKAGS